MTTLGSTGKARTESFDNKRKLFLVPLPPVMPEVDGNNSDLFDRHWNSIQEQIENLEKSLGLVRHVFHEMVYEGGDGGTAIVSQVSPRSATICKRITDSSGVFVKTEDRDALFEMHDWQRCISVGLASEKVSKLAYEGFQESTNLRNEKIAENIDKELNVDEIGILFISEDHRVQFPSDIQVFYIAPPTQNEIKQAIENYYKQQSAPTTEESE
ncbi:MAG: hypothetical protein CL887_06900 [Dehalococcoidia bacterium]|nr:hypothetical protein [Dehalococcoidia bacterium]|tara:strand:+ start:10251 stop:10889 length:639 start_codon:yes stop_codon:yes gene_type:complete